MHRISRQHIVYSIDKAHSPILRIASGEEVEFETYDARTGTIRKDTDLLDRPHPKGMNPATEPVFVEDAVPGDSLAVEICDIRLENEGFLAVKKNVGLLAHRADRYATKMIPVINGIAHFTDRVTFSVRPMIGVVGTAPEGEGVSTGYPGPHGGNMDNNEIRVGATVHLPVRVPGALFFLGDVHASMGDGEVSMVGFEICATVRTRFHLHKGETADRPWIETTDGGWVTTGDDLDPVRAMQIACEEMANRVMRDLSLSFEEAYMLVTARGDLAVCQACQPVFFP
ncbi:MAG: acetamidase/formamidase family protein [candidate division Zixibacteria bacterium]|nr:acetamidase/formamidase family protein [candidate division Zixibacteria bacterium]